MSIEFEKTDIDGLLIIKPHMYPDDCGVYKKYYEKFMFAENGIENIITTEKDRNWPTIREYRESLGIK